MSDPETAGSGAMSVEEPRREQSRTPGSPGGGEREPMVVAEGVGVSLGGERILESVDLTAERGTVTGLVGPNGAGKTTLLRALQAGIKPDDGTIRVANERLQELSTRRAARLVASVPQETALSFDFSVQETIEMGRTPHLSRFDTPGREDRVAVEEAMQQTQVTQFADRSIQTVSGGERQRVLLARALAQETPVLLLDEPTASLDISHAVETLELLRELVGDGKTAVAAIHDLDLAARFCDRLVLIAGGQVRAAGLPGEVLDRDTLRDAFGAEAIVTDDPVTGAPRVTTLPSHGETGERVHVIGRSEKTAKVVATLVTAGHEVTIGPVPDGDIAATTATGFDCETVTAPPFSTVDPALVDRATTLAAAADVAVRVGPEMNQSEAVLRATDRVVCVGEPTKSAESTHPAATVDNLSEVITENSS